ncbi:hypothetical protein FRACYDRAFT_188278 [Fragilariopsis cylindrus CCMP1102]|uniref:BTB domain-containing protein n=1 Tax=Fragilariopsis cylindrus CCMP1102 TaxID=635003 RepID=A0A1E7F9R2_9STRA|nr:hypothetical protein FRACYDRAFT_188278 [Fragilariopsis cylindrus CCMP1102]|eukprot:OEU14911.1 hypothetical protein FRACYDRAFT_188278 [Fragilariopsis cylindrus CCMP1102]
MPNISKREDVIKNDCNDAGTLTITIELQVATEKKPIWYPQPTYYDRTVSQLFGSIENSDVLFTVGNTSKEFVAHKCILALRARSLYELVLVEESSSKDSAENDLTNIELRDVDKKVFEILLEFVYTGKEPKLDDDEGTARSVLVAANRFGCTDLKLYAESVLVDKFLVPSNAAALLLFADSYSCALLKEATMNTYINDTKAVIESKADWTKLKESNDLLVELLLYSTSGRKKYSSIVDDGNALIDRAIVDADDLDVTSLRQRLQKVDLDLDGSREILVERWREYLRTKNNE